MRKINVSDLEWFQWSLRYVFCQWTSKIEECGQKLIKTTLFWGVITQDLDLLEVKQRSYELILPKKKKEYGEGWLFK